MHGQIIGVLTSDKTAAVWFPGLDDDNKPMPSPPPAITLCTLNAKYIHASLGLRYLQANMGELQAQTRLR